MLHPAVVAILTIMVLKETGWIVDGLRHLSFPRRCARNSILNLEHQMGISVYVQYEAFACEESGSRVAVPFS